MNRLVISLDIDGCICDFYNPYIERFGIPKKDNEISKNIYRVLSKDRDFWLNLPVINRPTFKVHQYTSARSIPKAWVKKYLEDNAMPKAPIYQLLNYYLSKVPRIKMGGCNLHIDDSLRVFIDCNLNGIPCLLMDNPANQDWGPIGRIYSLNKDEVEDCYHLYMDTMFPYFKEILKEYGRH